MLAATHALGGAAAAMAIATAAGLPPFPAALAGAFGALMPDLDSQGSKGARLLGPALALAAAACTMAGGWTRDELKLVLVLLLVGAIAPTLLAKCLGHRGVMHSAALHLVVGGAAAAAAALAHLPPWTVSAALFATVGSVVGGIALDACTIRGVPLLWPFRSEKVHLVPVSWRVRTGKRRELYVRTGLALLVTGLVLRTILVSRGAPWLLLRAGSHTPVAPAGLEHVGDGATAPPPSATGAPAPPQAAGSVTPVASAPPRKPRRAAAATAGSIPVLGRRDGAGQGGSPLARRPGGRP